jgi:DNA modification methylase
MQIVEIEIKKLKPAEYNPRTISTKEFNGLKKSLGIFGFVDPAIVNKDMTIIGGHRRLDAWKSLGNDTAPCVVVDLNKKQEKKLNVLLNSPKIAGKYDDLKLSELLEEMKLDDDYLALNLDELEPLDLSSEVEVKEDNYTIPDRVKTDLKLGDIIEIRKSGKLLHRIGCGSSTDVQFLERLTEGFQVDGVITDPPYGVDITGNRGGGSINDGRYVEIAGDKDTSIARDFYNTCVTMGYKNLVFLGGNYFTDFLPPSRCWVVWDKEKHEGLSFADGELAWTSFDKNMKIYKKFWHGNLAGKVDIAKEVMKKEAVNGTLRALKSHPTQKPIELHGWIIKDFFANSQCILDGFSGSGTTLLACHQMGKSCIAIEIILEYCQVAINRIKDLDPQIEIVKN